MAEQLHARWRNAAPWFVAAAAGALATVYLGARELADSNVAARHAAFNHYLMMHGVARLAPLSGLNFLYLPVALGTIALCLVPFLRRHRGMLLFFCLAVFGELSSRWVEPSLRSVFGGQEMEASSLYPAPWTAMGMLAYGAIAVLAFRAQGAPTLRIVVGAVAVCAAAAALYESLTMSPFTTLSTAGGVAFAFTIFAAAVAAARMFGYDPLERGGVEAGQLGNA